MHKLPWLTVLCVSLVLLAVASSPAQPVFPPQNPGGVPSGPPGFVGPSMDHAGALQVVLKLGILQGDAEGRLLLDRPMTRYELLVAWERVAGVLGFKAGDFSWEGIETDVPENHWARTSIGSLASMGLLPLVPFSDIDALHWAARATAALGEEARYLRVNGSALATAEDVRELAVRTLLAGRRLRPAGAMGRVNNAQELWGQLMSRSVGRGIDSQDSELSRVEFAVLAARFITWWHSPPRPPMPPAMGPQGRFRGGGFRNRTW